MGFRCVVIQIITLTRKCHFDEICPVMYIESCDFDNFQCTQWRKFRQNEKNIVSVTKAFCYIHHATHNYGIVSVVWRWWSLSVSCRDKSSHRQAIPLKQPWRIWVNESHESIKHCSTLLISMALCNTAVTPFLTHWSYCSFVLSHRYNSPQNITTIPIFEIDFIVEYSSTRIHAVTPTHIPDVVVILGYCFCVTRYFFINY